MPETFNTFFASPMGILQLAVALTISLCVFILFVFILINFIENRSQAKTTAEKKSIVATGSMTFFFMVFYLILRFQIGRLEMSDSIIHVVLVLIGLVMIVGGCWINILGRLQLGKYWANHIKIYEDHSLIAEGVFAWVRHPLYASLMLMFYGASVVYLNYAAFLANTLIFIPFMYYRAKQEEALLLKKLPAYESYQNKVGMFFPKF